MRATMGVGKITKGELMFMYENNNREKLALTRAVTTRIQQSTFARSVAVLYCRPAFSVPSYKLRLYRALVVLIKSKYKKVH